MGRGKSKIKKGSKKSGSKWQCPGEKSMQSSWVNRLDFVSIDGADDGLVDEEDVDGDYVSLSIISWNVLANSYTSRKSHPELPQQYQDVVFDQYRRGKLIREVLMGGLESAGNDDNDNNCSTNNRRHRLTPDVWALQEVDMDEILTKHLRSVGYEGIESPRMKLGGGAGGKVDSVGIYYRREKWTMLEHELIRLDDLSTLPASSEAGVGGEIGSINNNLRGLQNSFLRRNVALLVRLQSKAKPNCTVVVAVAHLFWNPLYEYVKLCQTHYIMLRTKLFLKSKDEPFLLCGDLNSLPGSSVHKYLSVGVVNAKTVAPWYRCAKPNDGVDDSETGDKNPRFDTSAVSDITKELSNLELSIPPNGNTEEVPIETNQKPKQQQIRYLLDFNLNRLCRWFRILGLDAGLETEAEERMRTKEGKIKIFDRCREEGRVLITTSNSLLSRTFCPPGTYLINPKSLASNWQIVLVHILLTHGVTLCPSNFLTRCVVCNGNICSVHDHDLKRKIFTDHQAPFDQNSDLAVFQCDGCGQGYWWCDRPTSSASRVKGQATMLYQMCLRGQVSVAPRTQKHMFEHVKEEEERKRGWDWTMKGSELLNLRLEVAEWLKDEQLSCPIPRLRSAYKDDNSSNGESLSYTNVTRYFEGTLDYIFFTTDSIVQTQQLYVPKTYEELNTLELSRGHLLPSNVWPSDHLAIGASLRIRS